MPLFIKGGREIHIISSFYPIAPYFVPTLSALKSSDICFNSRLF